MIGQKMASFIILVFVLVLVVIPLVADAQTNRNLTLGSAAITAGDRSTHQLVFYDRGMRLWKFRYCFWKSSQSFVFTRGWNRFVKDKNLKAKDCVMFYACQRDEEGNVNGSGVVAEVEEEKFCLIDVEYNDNNNGNDDGGVVGLIEDDDDDDDEGGNGMEVELRLNLGNNDGVEDEDEELGENGFRLFGVQINADSP